MRPFLRFRATSVVLAFVLSMLLPFLSITGASAVPGDITLASTADGGTPKGDSDSMQASVSADGRTVAFESFAMNLDPADTDDLNDVYVKDLDTHELVLASTNGVTKGDNSSSNASLALDGSRVAFDTFASNLDPEDVDGAADVYVKDLTSGGLTLASVSGGGVKGDGSSITPSLSSGGTIVAFSSFATNLHPGDDAEGTSDVFVKNLVTDEIVIASSSTAGIKGNGASFDPSLSADGTRVAFWSSANNLDLADRDTDADVYVKDLTTGVITLASTSDTGVKGLGSSSAPSLSADGGHVAFESFASLDPADGDGLADVYVKDLTTENVMLASTSDDGTKGDGGSGAPSLSTGGASVAFQSDAANLHPDDVDPAADVYVKDLLTGEITLASSPVSNRPSLSANGAFVGYESSATLDPTDTDGLVDIYVRELGLAPIEADLSVTVVDSPDPVGSGQLLTYVVTVTNHGGSDATEVRLVDAIDDANLRSVATSQGSCVEDPRLGTVDCALGSLAVDASATVEIVVRAVRPKSSPIVNTATVSGREPDPFLDNNTDSETTTIGTS